MIFNIQRYSLHDGRGLRTTVFLKGCPLRCSWCSNPESQKSTSELSWDSSLCMQCGECMQIHPDGPVRRKEEYFQFHPSLQKDPESFRDICPTRALQVIGENKSPSRIAEEIEKDRVFYRSGGGVTLSGGEPLMQSELAEEIAKEVRARRIPLAIETCLHIPWENIEKLIPWTDEFLCDVKHIDPVTFAGQTGGNLSLIWENLEKLAEYPVPVRARIPVIPGFNHEKETIMAILKRLEDKNLVYAVDFMPYHPLGARKYKNLGRDYSHPLTALDEKELLPYLEMAEQLKLEATAGG